MQESVDDTLLEVDASNIEDYLGSSHNLKETYKDITFEIFFRCNCYEDPDAGCADSYLIHWDSKILLSRFLFWKSRSDIAIHARRAIDALLEVDNG